MKINILGINIDIIDLSGVLNLIKKWIRENNQRIIVTVNPEFVVEAQKNSNFKKILNEADMATCDGFGLVLASGRKLKRVTGVEIAESLLKSTNQELKIYLLGGLIQAAELLQKKYPCTVVGAENGGKLNIETWLLDNNNLIVDKIKQSQANVLLVAFGQVKQEMWIKNNLSLMSNIKVAIGVGGTFDYLSGQVKRAPLGFRKMGLEWLYRLLTQPARIGRIYTALFRFGGLVLKEKIKK